MPIAIAKRIDSYVILLQDYFNEGGENKVSTYIG